jgi:hypothetical protein
MSAPVYIEAEMNFISSSVTGGPVLRSDLRKPMNGPRASEAVAVKVFDAGAEPDLGLHASGFEMIHAPSAVTDFYDCNLVMSTYYDECKALARKLTGAHTAFAFDHIIREPEVQYNGGGIDGAQHRSGVANGGGYIGSVHLDYTDRTTWDRYLSLHGESVPAAEHVYALNFWRPVSSTVDGNPLAVCDARTVVPEDLLEVDVYGYGAENYSWYDIGIETFSVAASERHRWYYYPGMTPNDVLVIKSYDSAGVIGTTPPHASFVHPEPQAVARRSIELRVLCFC